MKPSRRRGKKDKEEQAVFRVGHSAVKAFTTVKHGKIVEQLGGIVVDEDDPSQLMKMNVLIVSDGAGAINENRTKFVVAISLGIAAVDMGWLLECQKKKKFVSTKPFEITNADVSFPISQSYERQRDAQASGGLLKDRIVCVSEGVAGKRGIPALELLHILIKNTGAAIADGGSSLLKLVKAKQNASSVIIIANESDSLAPFASVVSKGAVVLTGKAFMDGIKFQSFEPAARTSIGAAATSIRPPNESVERSRSGRKNLDKIRIGNLTLPSEREAQMATEHKLAVALIKQEHDAKVSAINEQHAAELSKLEREHKKEIKTLTAQKWTHEIVFEDHVTKPVTRTLNNENLGDAEERSNVGSGKLLIIKSRKGDEKYNTCQLIHPDGEQVLFEAIIHANPEEAHKHMEVNLEESNSLKWRAYDTSVGNGAKLREYTLRFDSGLQMLTFIVFAYDGNYHLANEFLTPGSRFYPVKRTGPPHPVMRDINAMNVDGEGNDLEAHAPPLDERVAASLYGNVILETQGF